MEDSTVFGVAPLRILIVSAYAPPHLGGVEVVVAQQAATLAALGHQVTVLTSQCEAEASGAEGQTWQPRIDQGGYRVIRIPAWNGLERCWSIAVPVFRPPQLLLQLIRLSRAADVIHVHDAYHPSSVLAALLARLLRKPLFATQHAGIVEHGMLAVLLAQRIVYATVGRLVWRWASAVTAYNPIVQNFLLERHVPAAKIRLTCNGIDTREFCPGDAESVQATRKRYGLPAEIPIVFHAGRLVPKKGSDKLLAASGPEYQVVIAGPGRIPGQVPPHVTFLGPVDRDDLRDLYQASDIFAFPATGEMLTLAMQEAMACGLPAVVTADPGYASYDLDPSGIALVEPEPSELRAEFLDILGNPERRQRMQVYSRRAGQGTIRLGAQHHGSRGGVHQGLPAAGPGPVVLAAGTGRGGRAGVRNQPAGPGRPAPVGAVPAAPADPVHGALLQSCGGSPGSGHSWPAGPFRLHRGQPRGAGHAVPVRDQWLPAGQRRRPAPPAGRIGEAGTRRVQLVSLRDRAPALRQLALPHPGFAARAPGDHRLPAHPGRGRRVACPPARSW